MSGSFNLPSRSHFLIRFVSIGILSLSGRGKGLSNRSDLRWVEVLMVSKEALYIVELNCFSLIQLCDDRAFLLPLLCRVCLIRYVDGGTGGSRDQGEFSKDLKVRLVSPSVLYKFDSAL